MKQNKQLILRDSHLIGENIDLMRIEQEKREAEIISGELLELNKFKN